LSEIRLSVIIPAKAGSVSQQPKAGHPAFLRECEEQKLDSGLRRNDELVDSR